MILAYSGWCPFVTPVIPAKAGIQWSTLAAIQCVTFWIPACAGMTATKFLFHQEKPR